MNQQVSYLSATSGLYSMWKRTLTYRGLWYRSPGTSYLLTHLPQKYCIGSQLCHISYITSLSCLRWPQLVLFYLSKILSVAHLHLQLILRCCNLMRALMGSRPASSTAEREEAKREWKGSLCLLTCPETCYKDLVYKSICLGDSLDLIVKCYCWPVKMGFSFSFSVVLIFPLEEWKVGNITDLTSWLLCLPGHP